jgi:Flp pilus assembly protein TadG
MPNHRAFAGSGQAIVEFALVLPIMLLLVLAIADFARLFTTQLTVEAAAREAADYGAFQASQWDPASANATVFGPTGMVERACTAASSLPGYVASGDATTLCSAAGSNPQFSCTLEDGSGTAIGPCEDGSATCSNPATDPPCLVDVSMAYTFHTFFSVTIPFLNFSPYPPTLAVTRDSRYAVSDLGGPP